MSSPVQKVMPTLPVSELRTRQAEVLAQLKKSPVLLTQRGRGAGVLVDPDLWNELVERAERYEALLGLSGPVSGFIRSEQKKAPRKAGSAKHLGISMSDDFDELLDDFDEYM